MNNFALQLRCRSRRLPFAACCAALLCAALLRFVMQIIVNTFSLGWRWQNFIWFSAVAGSGVGTVTLLLPLSYLPLSLLSFSCPLFYLPPAPHNALFLHSRSMPRSVCLVFRCLPLSVCVCPAQMLPIIYTHRRAHTPSTHTPTIALAFAQCRGANSEPRHITKFRTVCNCNAAAVDAASSNTANVPKKAWRVQNANGRASCPIDSWPRGVREGQKRDREGGRVREVAGIECRLTGHICG